MRKIHAFVARLLRTSLVALAVLGASCKPATLPTARGGAGAAMTRPVTNKVFRPRSPAALAATEPREESNERIDRCWSNWPDLERIGADEMRTITLPTSADEFTTREGGATEQVVLVRGAEGGGFPKRLNLLGANRRYCVDLPSLVQDEAGDLFVAIHCTSQIAFTVGDEAAASGKIHLQTVCPDAGQASVAQP